MTESEYKINDAISFATESHKGQFRKGSEELPFIVHPMDVFALVRSWGINNHAVLRAAICHDILEDCNVTQKQLSQVIGEESTRIVEELTFIPDAGSRLTKPKQKQRYMDSFGEKSIEALVIKLADRILNTRDFLRSSNPSDKSYATKYLLRAKNLFLAFESEVRRAEKTNHFSRSFGIDARGARILLNDVERMIFMEFHKHAPDQLKMLLEALDRIEGEINENSQAGLGSGLVSGLASGLVSGP